MANLNRDPLHFIGLMHQSSTNEPAIPTVVFRKTDEIKQLGSYNQDYEIGHQAIRQKQAWKRYREFKSDLSQTGLHVILQKGNTPAARQSNSEMLSDLNWEMRSGSEDGARNRFAYRVQREDGREEVFSAIHATEALLGKLSLDIYNQLKSEERTINLKTINFRFTRPFYEDDAKRDTYRDHIQECITAVQRKLPLPNTQYLLGEKDWEYEQNGVFYYYAGIEKVIDLADSGATYLVVDIGGSTADLSIIQVAKTTEGSTARPISKSVSFAGRDIDEYLAQKWLGADYEPDNDALHKIVEAAKIQLFSKSETQVSVSWKQYEATWDRQQLEGWLHELWEHCVLRGALAGLVQEAHTKAAGKALFNSFSSIKAVFLAGGSSELPGLTEMIKDTVAAHLESPPENFIRSEAPPSTLAAIGLAWETGRRLEFWKELETARDERVYLQLKDDSGQLVTFRRKEAWAQQHIKAGLPESTFVGLLSHDEPTDGKWKLKDFETVTLEKTRLRRDWRVRFFNGLYEDEDVEALPFETWPLDAGKLQVHTAKVDATAEVGFACDLAYGDSGKTRLEATPFLKGYKTRASGRKDTVTLSGGKSPKAGRFSVPLTAPRLAQTATASKEVVAHVCVDLGMTNTVVAVLLEAAQPPALSAVHPLNSIINERKDQASKYTRRQREEELKLLETSMQADQAEHVRLEDELGKLQLQHDEHEASIRQADQIGGNKAEELKPLESALVTIHSPRTDLHKEIKGLESKIEELTTTYDDLQRNQAKLSAEIERLRATYDQLWSDHAELADKFGRLKETRGEPLAKQPTQSVADLLSRLHGSYEELEALSSGRTIADGDVWAKVQQREEEGDTLLFNMNDRPEASGGLRYSKHVVRTILGEVLKPKTRLIVLAGPPGTGKSSLVRAVAHLLNGDLDDVAARDQFYHLEPVSPVWMAPSSLMGWYSEIDKQFHPTGFWEFLYRAKWYNEQVREEEERRYFCICLDEFNLARPEQYLSEVFSRMESAEQDPVLPVARAPLEGQVDLILPSNVKLFATLNVDASTHLLSPKVLDRSCFVQITCTWDALKAHAKARLTQWKDRYPEEAKQEKYRMAFSKLFLPEEESEASMLHKVYEVAEHGRLPFGHRVLSMAFDYAERQIDLFAAAEADDEDVFARSLLDDILCTFFLPKLPNCSEAWGKEYESELGNLKTMCAEKLAKKARAPKILGLLQNRPGQMAWPGLLSLNGVDSNE